MIRSALTILWAVLAESYRSKCYIALVLGLAGAAVGFNAGMQPSPDWRNEFFGPLCGFMFWGGIGWFIGLWIDMQLHRMAHAVQKIFQ